MRFVTFVAKAAHRLSRGAAVSFVLGVVAAAVLSVMQPVDAQGAGCPVGWVLSGGKCIPAAPVIITCHPGLELWQLKCVPKCPPGAVHAQPDGKCLTGTVVLPVCGGVDEIWNGKCVAKCPPNYYHIAPDGACITTTVVKACTDPYEMWNGKCVDKCPPGTVRVASGQCAPPPCPPGYLKLPNGLCIPVQCPAGQERVNGTCVPKCPVNTHRLSNGTCVPNVIILLPCPSGQVRGPDGNCHPI